MDLIDCEDKIFVSPIETKNSIHFFNVSQDQDAMMTVTNKVPEHHTPKDKNNDKEKGSLRPSREPMSLVQHEKKIIAERFNIEHEARGTEYRPTKDQQAIIDKMIKE